MLERWIIDFRYAARRLRTRPTYAALAVLTIALGAGGTAAIFSVVRALLLDPLPIAHEEQVGVLWFQLSWREEEFLGLRPDFPGFQAMAAYRPGGSTLEAPDGQIRQIPGYAVSAELFDVLGAPPMLGRTFKAGEDLVGADRVVLLGYALWQELGADPNIIGKPLLLGGAAHTVVGVMPRGFWFPSPTTQMWTAAQMNPQNKSGQYSLIGRLAEGQSFDSMQGPLRILASKLAQNFQYSDPVWARPRNPSITPARDFFVGDVRPSLLATLAAMGVILLIGCANVTALILGQVDARASEIAVRAALGANRQRVIQQLVMESLVIGVLAGGLGAALAAIGFEALVGSLPLGALAENVRLDWTVFWVSMLASLAASVLVSIIPGIALWRGSRLQSTMSTMRTGGMGARGGRLEGALVVAQITLAVLLVTGAGLLVRSVANLRSIDSGLKVNEVAVVDAVLPRQRVAPGERQRTINAMLMSLKGLPGVTAVAAAQKLPLRDRGDNYGISIQGRPNPNATTAFRMVTPDYFSAMGIPIRRGRNFGPEDHEGAEPVVIINEALAQRFFPGEDPIGHVLQTLDTGERIIGVAGNTHETGLKDPPVPARYMLYDHIRSVPPNLSFVIRVSDKDRIGTALAAARSAIAGEKGRVVVTQTATMRDIFEEAMGPTGRVVTLLSLLGGLALFLGAVGVYGVSWHYVVRRSRDYSIRIALGEPPSRVFWQVAGRSAILVGAGTVIGVASAFAVTRLLSSLLYGVGPTDPLALFAAVFILSLTGVAAAFIPARRASLLDPATLLRES